MQKHVELEVIIGIEVKAEDEPEAETIVGSGRVALRPLSMDITSFSSKLSLFFGCILDSSPHFGSHLH